ncbi:MAG: hypothetical protein JWM81_897 [Candidatus Saccharibacteria bacterium]|nr:hypothetical protein [Candidatus Saccharibacteria bacterium]
MEKEFSTYLFTLEVTPLNVGKAYASLPLYCTLMYRFHSPLSAQELIAAVEPLFARTKPLLLEAGEHQAFGPRQVLVTMLRPSPVLLLLHNALYTALNDLGVTYAEAEWVGSGYKPHVSDQSGKSFAKLSPHMSTAIYLIEAQFPLEGNQRYIRAKFQLAE